MVGWKKDLEKSTKDLIIDNWGEELGNKILNCFKDCMKEDKDQSQVEECLAKCLEQEIAAEEITLPDITKMMDLMSHYETIGS